MAMDARTYVTLGLDELAPLSMNGRGFEDFRVSLSPAQDRIYHPCPEAFPSAEIPRGDTRRRKAWRSTGQYAGTLRNLTFHTTPGAASDVNLIVFNDGSGYYDPNGPVRAAAVLDSLFASGEIPPTLAVFVDPGLPESAADLQGEARWRALEPQRRDEYDALTPDFGLFLVREVLPLAVAETGVSLSEDPRRRAICGISSGGICAFTAAWMFPESFGGVISHCGSYVNIHGGHNWPYLLRARPRKPIRVFLQSGENDAQGITGDWPLANQTMASALRFAGYDYRFEFGVGGHSLRHGGAIFADTLRWLWRSEA